MLQNEPLPLASQRLLNVVIRQHWRMCKGGGVSGLHDIMHADRVCYAAKSFLLTSHHRHHVLRLIERKSKTERKKSQGSTMQALRSHNSDDESMKHPNIVAWNPGLITQDASQTVKHLLGRRKKEQLKLFCFFSWNRLMGKRKRNTSISLTGEGNIDLSSDR